MINCINWILKFTLTFWTKAAWPSDQHGGLAIQGSRVRVPWPVIAFVFWAFRLQILGHNCKIAIWCWLLPGVLCSVMLHLHYLFQIIWVECLEVSGETKCTFILKKALTNHQHCRLSSQLDVKRTEKKYCSFSGSTFKSFDYDQNPFPFSFHHDLLVVHVIPQRF